MSLSAYIEDITRRRGNLPFRKRSLSPVSVAVIISHETRYFTPRVITATREQLVTRVQLCNFHGTQGDDISLHSQPRVLSSQHGEHKQ